MGRFWWCGIEPLADASHSGAAGAIAAAPTAVERLTLERWSCGSSTQGSGAAHGATRRAWR